MWQTAVHPQLILKPRSEFVYSLLHDTLDIFTPSDDDYVSRRLRSELLAELTDYVLNGLGAQNADLDNDTVSSKKNCHGWKFAITSKGSLGTGFGGIKPEELVVVSHGAEVTFVLRKDSTSHEAHSLLSSTYFQASWTVSS